MAISVYAREKIKLSRIGISPDKTFAGDCSHTRMRIALFCWCNLDKTTGEITLLALHLFIATNITGITGAR